MAKFVGQLVVIEETNLLSIFYLKYLCESYNTEIKYPPVQYYDIINKKGIELYFETLDENGISAKLQELNNLMNDITKTVSHGFISTILQDNIKDEGLINKLKAVEVKKVRNYESPYNDILKKYSIHTYNG